MKTCKIVCHFRFLKKQKQFCQNGTYDYIALTRRNMMHGFMNGKYILLLIQILQVDVPFCLFYLIATCTLC